MHIAHFDFASCFVLSSRPEVSVSGSRRTAAALPQDKIDSRLLSCGENCRLCCLRVSHVEPSGLHSWHSLRRFGIGRTCPSLDACIDGRRFIPHVSRSCLHEFQQQSRRRGSVPDPTARTAVMRLCSAKTDRPHANQSDRRHVEVRRREELGGRQGLRLHRRRCSYMFSALCRCHLLSARSCALTVQAQTTAAKTCSATHPACKGARAWARGTRSVSMRSTTIAKARCEQ